MTGKEKEQIVITLSCKIAEAIRWQAISKDMHDDIEAKYWQGQESAYREAIKIVKSF